LGVGPGTEGPDAQALGQDPWSSAERMDRYGEFVQTLRQVLDGDGDARTTISGRHYAATNAPSTPGTLQTPFPLTIAAGGPRGLSLAASSGQQWVTIGPGSGEPRTPADIVDAVRRQRTRLDQACAKVGRDADSLGKVVLWTPADPVISSLDQFEALAAPYAEMGIDQLVLHHPAQTGPYSGSVPVFEKIAERSAATGY
jgi:alkanesulfonate monooxygenase SsuD/methylene tetrahydromethanopterin reductase-like flavin-dependent oxidoreductase (luciferase family)